MDPPDGGNRSLHLRHCPISRGGDVGRSAGQPPERVFAISRVVANTGNDLGMGRLDEKSSDSTNKRGRISQH